MLKGLLGVAALAAILGMSAAQEAGRVRYGAGLPATCVVGDVFLLSTTGLVHTCGTPNTWTATGGSSGSVPAGSIVLTLAAACPTGFAEVASLSGRTVIGTVAANADVGGTGGADSVTPAGTNTVPTLTMNSYTPAGSVSAHAAGGTVKLYTANTSTGTSPVTHTFTGTPATLTGSVSAPTFTGSPLDNRSAFAKVLFCSKT